MSPPRPRTLCSRSQGWGGSPAHDGRVRHNLGWYDDPHLSVGAAQVDAGHLPVLAGVTGEGHGLAPAGGGQAVLTPADRPVLADHQLPRPPPGSAPPGGGRRATARATAPPPPPATCPSCPGPRRHTPPLPSPLPHGIAAPPKDFWSQSPETQLSSLVVRILKLIKVDTYQYA